MTDRSLRLFRSPLSAVSWWVRELQRRDGYRAQPCDPRVVGPINLPSLRAEDRLLLLSLIGQAVERVPRRQRKAVLLVARDGMGPVELSAHLGCRPVEAGEMLRRAWARTERELRRAGVMHDDTTDTIRP